MRIDSAAAAELRKSGILVGSKIAATTIVEFADFQCPACRTLHETLEALISKESLSVAVRFRHFPLAGHEHAFAAAVAAECASYVGRFREMSSVMFSKQDSLGLLPWQYLGATAGILDTAEFRRCRDGTKARKRIEEDVAAGTALGVQGTPMIVVGQNAVLGAVSFDSILTLLRTPK